MALSYGFFDAELTSSGQYDRVYAAEHFAKYFSLFIANGIFPDPATQMQVIASDTPDMNVNVRPGYGWINGYYADNPDPYPMAIQAAHGSLNRVDAVVLRWSKESRSMELIVKQGANASSPISPEVTRNSDVYELILATVTVAAGTTAISQSMITDKRPDSSVCGWVTGVVDQIDTTELFTQYDAEFQEWFEGVKDQLSGDVVGNLVNSINERVKYSDKATEAEALAGTDNTKWMTPATAKVSAEAFSFNVGDILKTQRKNLGSKWALCNGASFNKDAYPEFFNVKPPEASGAQLASYNTVTGTICFLGRIPDNTQTLCVGSIKWENIGSDTYANILRLYSIEPYTGKISTIVSTNLGSQYRIDTTLKLIKVGNKFLIAATCNLSSHPILIYTADSLNGPWTFVTSISTSTSLIFDLWYDETVSKVYIAIQNTQGYGRIIYAPIGSLSSWTTVNVTALSSNSFLRVGDTYAFFGYGASNRVDCIHTTTPEVSSWTQTTVKSDAGSYVPYTATVFQGKVILFNYTSLIISTDSSLNSWSTISISVDTSTQNPVIVSVDEEQQLLFLFYNNVKKDGSTPLCVLDLVTKQQIQSYKFKISTDMTIEFGKIPSSVIYKGWLYAISGSQVLKVPLCRFPLIPSDDSEYNYVKVKE